MIARKYRYLIALAREKHFGRAAAACHVSPSTLSAAIRDIENELGVVVVERGQQFAGLTAEGQCVLAYAQRAAASAENLRQELARLRDDLSGRLRIGVIPTALTVVASLSAAFARRHPLVTLEVRALATETILARLRRYELDAGVIYLGSAAESDLDAIPAWHEDHVLLAPADGPLQGREALSWHEAAGLPLCLLTPDMQNRRTIDATFAQVGARPVPGLETDSIASVLAHVATGMWCSIVPRSVIELIGLPRGCAALRLEAPTLNWRTAVITLRGEPAPPMVAALRELLRATPVFGNPEDTFDIS